MAPPNNRVQRSAEAKVEWFLKVPRGGPLTRGVRVRAVSLNNMSAEDRKNAYCNRLLLAPQAQYDRNDNNLEKPVAAVNGREFPWPLIPQSSAHKDQNRENCEPYSHADRAQPIGDPSNL